jgi:hypothetical protein
VQLSASQLRSNWTPEWTPCLSPLRRLTMNEPSVPSTRRCPYASAWRVDWIVDNGSSHRGRTSVERLERRWPNLVLVHLPLHASRLNQIEIGLF